MSGFNTVNVPKNSSRAASNPVHKDWLRLLRSVLDDIGYSLVRTRQITRNGVRRQVIIFALEKVTLNMKKIQVPYPVLFSDIRQICDNIDGPLFRPFPLSRIQGKIYLTDSRQISEIVGPYYEVEYHQLNYKHLATPLKSVVNLQSARSFLEKQANKKLGNLSHCIIKNKESNALFEGRSNYPHLQRSKSVRIRCTGKKVPCIAISSVMNAVKYCKGQRLLFISIPDEGKLTLYLEASGWVQTLGKIVPDDPRSEYNYYRWAGVLGEGRNCMKYTDYLLSRIKDKPIYTV